MQPHTISVAVLFLQQTIPVWTSPQSNECHIHLLSGASIHLHDSKYQSPLKDVPRKYNNNQFIYIYTYIYEYIYMYI